MGAFTPIKPVPPQISLDDLYTKAMEYLKGVEGEGPNCATGSHWMMQAAIRGHVEAQYRMGVLLGAGIGIEQNLEEAFKWTQKAADQGCVGAQHSLGDMFRKGEGVKADDLASAYWYKQAADKGDPQAQYNLAVAYEIGRGVPEDYAQARQYYELSAKQGVLDAQHNLAVLYLMGKGVETDLDRAIGLLRQTADSGYSLSSSVLERIGQGEALSDEDEDSDEDDEESEHGINPHQIVRGLPEQFNVKIFSSTTASDHSSRANESRLIHMLRCKGVNFDLVDLDLQPKERSAEVLQVSGTAVLPQLHINGKYLGNYDVLQELEDSGRLNLVFEQERVSSTPRCSNVSTASPTRNSQWDRIKTGAFSACASTKSIHLEWHEAQPSKAYQNNASWLLTMDSEPLFVGAATEYTVVVEDSEIHQFGLYRIPNDRRKSLTTNNRLSTGSTASSDAIWERYGELSLRCQP
jgi:glutaredoxin-related protein